MSIRYFATNRNRSDLTDPLQRRQGYYWIDVREYMKYYMATLDTNDMPKVAVLQQSEQELGYALSNGDPSKIPHVVVCVHGYNQELYKARDWFSSMADGLRENSLGDRLVVDPSVDEINASKMFFVGFSWPSNGSKVTYEGDRSEARESASAFACFLLRLQSWVGKGRVHVIAHSMGNYLTCLALKHIDEEIVSQAQIADSRIRAIVNKDFSLGKFIMLAPDIERRSLVRVDVNGHQRGYHGDFYGGIKNHTQSTHCFYSTEDKVLGLSEIEHGAKDVLDKLNPWGDGPEHEKRLGHAYRPDGCPDNFFTINSSRLHGGEISHSTHIDSIPILNKIGEILNED